jgi:hypothetical protein
VNWRRGAFRVWLVASVLWVAVASWMTYERSIAPRGLAAAQQKCFDARKADRVLGNPFDCFTGGVRFDHLIPLSTVARDYITLAFVPVLVALLSWLIGAWIVAGFRSRAGRPPPPSVQP